MNSATRQPTVGLDRPSSRLLEGRSEPQYTRSELNLLGHLQMKRLAQALAVVLVATFVLSGMTARADSSPVASGPVIAKQLIGLTWDGKEFIASCNETN